MKMEMMPKNWRGVLTFQNMRGIGVMLFRLLDKKKFTFTHLRPSVSPIPMTATTLELNYSVKNGPIDVFRIDGVTKSSFLRINFSSEILVWLTRLPKKTRDPEFKNPHFSFTNNQVIITQHLSGELVYWIFTTENH